jgi:hypothetical protein
MVKTFLKNVKTYQQWLEIAYLADGTMKDWFFTKPDTVFIAYY